MSVLEANSPPRKRFFVPPQYEPEEKTRLAELLHRMLNIWILFTAAFLVYSLFNLTGSIPWYLGMGVIGLTVIALLYFKYLIRKGRIRIAGVLFSATIWLMVTAVILLSGSLRAPGIVGYFAGLLVVGTLFRTRGLIVFVIATLLMTLAFYFAEANLLISPQNSIIHFQQWIVIAFSLIGTMLVIRVISDDMEKIINRLELEIVQRKMTEESLRKSEERYRSLFEHMPMPLWEQDFSAVKRRIDALRHEGVTDLKAYCEAHPETVYECARQVKIVDVNQATLTLYKANNKSDLLGNLNRIMSGEAYEVFKQQMIAFAEGATEFEAATTNKTLDGETVHIHLKNSLAPGHEQSFSKALLSTADITERKQAEMALRESDNRFQQLSELSLEGVALHKGELLMINQAGAEMFGYKTDELIGESIFKVINPDDRLMMEQKVAGGREAFYETTGIYKDGSHFPIEIHSKSTLFNGERVRAAVIRDITKRKKQEDALRQYANQLEMLNSITRLISSSLNFEEIIPEVTNALERLISFDFLGIALLDVENELDELFSFRINKKLGKITSMEGWKMPLEFKEVLATQKGMLREDITQSQHLVEQRLADQGLRSAMNVPLISSGNAIGLFNIGSNQIGAYTETELALAQTVADQIAAAVENTYLHQRVQLHLDNLERKVTERTAALSALNNVSRKITSTLDLEEILQTIANYTLEILACDKSLLILVDMVKEEVTDIVGAGYGREFRNFTFEEFQEGISGWVAEQMRPTFSPNLQRDPRNQGRALASAKKYTEDRSGLIVPISIQGKLIGTLTAVYKAQQENLSQDDLELATVMADQAAIAIENAQLFKQNEAYTIELEQLYNRQSALANIELAINRPHELQAVLNQIAMSTTELLPAKGGVSVILWDAETEEFFTSASTVRRQTHNTAAKRVRREGGATRWIIDNVRPLVVENIEDDPFGANTMLPEHNFRAYMGVPLLNEGKPVGVLYALEHKPRHFTAEDIDFLKAMANRAAVAISNVRHHEQAQVLAALEERQRLARDLHDAVSQTLFSASLIAESLPLLWQRKPAAVSNGLTELHLLTRGALAEMRTLLLELRPDSFSEVSLTDLLHQLGEALSGRTGVAVQTNLLAKPDLPEAVKYMIFRIAQEAMNNIAKHANASEIEVILADTPLELRLEVRDNGRGFTLASIPPGHLGVGIMQERAREVGATLTIASRPNKGTEVTLTWPKSFEGAFHG